MDILLLIIPIGAFCFWIHAERKLKLPTRIINATIFWGLCLVAFGVFHQYHTYYNRGWLSGALKNTIETDALHHNQEFLELVADYRNLKVRDGDKVTAGDLYYYTVRAKNTAQDTNSKPPSN